MGTAKQAGSFLFGEGGDAGALGVGQYKADPYQYNTNSFQSTMKTDLRRGDFNDRRNASMRREAPMMDASQQNQARQRQMSLANALEAQSRGEGPSLAQDQLQRATAANINSSMAMANSARGVSPGQAMRMAQQQRAAAQNQAGMDSASLRMREQMAAREQLGGVVQGMRGQDQSFASANQQAALNQQSLNDAQERFYSQGMAGLDQFDLNRGMDLERLRGQQALGIQGVNAQAYEGSSNRRAGFVSGLAEGAMALSDKNQKKDIKPAKSSLMDDILGGMGNPSSLEREITGKGPQMSLMSDAPEMKAVENTEVNASQELAPKPIKESDGSAHKSMGKNLMGLAALSDEKQKKEVAPTEKKLANFVDALKAYEYKYKDPSMTGAGEGTFVSPMAQDLEKSELGKGMVMDTPQGKMVDYGKGAGVMLATAAMLNDKMKGLEEAFKNRKKRA